MPLHDYFALRFCLDEDEKKQEKEKASPDELLFTINTLMSFNLQDIQLRGNESNVIKDCIKGYPAHHLDQSYSAQLDWQLRTYQRMLSNKQTELTQQQYEDIRIFINNALLFVERECKKESKNDAVNIKKYIIYCLENKGSQRDRDALRGSMLKVFNQRRNRESQLNEIRKIISDKIVDTSSSALDIQKAKSTLSLIKQGIDSLGYMSNDDWVKVDATAFMKGVQGERLTGEQLSQLIKIDPKVEEDFAGLDPQGLLRKKHRFLVRWLQGKGPGGKPTEQEIQNFLLYCTGTDTASLTTTITMAALSSEAGGQIASHTCFNKINVKVDYDNLIERDDTEEGFINSLKGTIKTRNVYNIS